MADLHRRTSTAAPARPLRRAAPPSEVADVDCQGETKDGRPITVKGKVTQEVEGRCVKGDLTAKVAGRTVFRVSPSWATATPPPRRTGRATPARGGHPHGHVTAVTVTVTESFRGK